MTESGLLCAYRLDGAGGGEALEWPGVARWQSGDGILWVHLDQDAGGSDGWLVERSGLDPLVVEALLAENTRPRCVPMDGGTMLFLRGVNLNPGASPEDMVSIRMWLEADRVISVRIRRLLSVDDLRVAIAQGRGPTGVGDFVAWLADRLADRMGGVIADIDDAVDRLQEQVLESGPHTLRTDLNNLRREIIAMRRYLAPQREALIRLANQELPGFTDRDRLQAREEADRVTRYVEDLDSARDRATVTQEELDNRLSEQLNSRMYVLSMVAAIFLPLGFLTGLFGINVGGIPMAENPSGFVDIVLILLVVVVVQVVLFRWRRWF
jgi:zinc transporter